MGLTNVVGACVLFGVLYGRFKSPYRIVPDRMGMCRSLPPVVSVEVGLWRVHVETWTRRDMDASVIFYHLECWRLSTLLSLPEIYMSLLLFIHHSPQLSKLPRP